MAVSIIAEKYDAAGEIMREYLCDRAEDLQTIKGFNSGSTAYVIAEKKRYIVNCCNVWCELPASSSSGGASPAGNDYSKEIIGLLDGSIESLVIPKGLTETKNEAIQMCKSLVSVTFPDGFIKLGGYTFSYCTALKSVIFPDTLEEIGSNAFSSCSSLESVKFPDSVTTIGSYVFKSCTALKSFIFPDTAKSVPSSMFEGCTSLESVVMSKQTEKVAANCFKNCTKCLIYDFSKVTIIPTLLATSAFSGINANAQIKVPLALCDEWKAATNWATYASYIVGV